MKIYADDGSEFKTVKECEEYEKKIEEKKAKEFLKRKETYKKYRQMILDEEKLTKEINDKIEQRKVLAKSIDLFKKEHLENNLEQKPNIQKDNSIDIVYEMLKNIFGLNDSELKKIIKIEGGLEKQNEGIFK